MNRLLTACAFAASMILVALATANGTIPAESGETMLIVMPALAIATMRSNKCCGPLKGSRA